MTRIYRSVALVMLGWALFVAGCGGGRGGGTSTAVLTGRTTSANGAALGGVTVSAGSASTTSAGDGTYSLTAGTGANVKVQASKSGSVSTFQVVSLTAGQTVPMDFALLATGQTSSLTGLQTTPATVTDSRGGEVKLAANSLVDSNGAAVNAATVTVTCGLPSDAAYAGSFPGLFIGTKAGADTDIESFGFVNITITSSAGLPCNLKPGATADIAIPVAAGNDPGTPTIDLWSLDEASGKWLFAVTATRDASGAIVVYRATVTHFSTYNCDRPLTSTVSMNVTVKDSQGALVSGASVVLTSKDQTGGGIWQGRGVTGTNGVVQFPRVPPGTVKGQALFGNQAGTAGSYDVTNGIGTMLIRVYAPSVLTPATRTFTVVYMDGNQETPVANLPISVNIEAHPSLIVVDGVTNANGQATLNLKAGGDSYECIATAIVNGATLVPTVRSVNSVNDIPDKWVLVPLN